MNDRSGLPAAPANNSTRRDDTSRHGGKPTAAELLATRGALLTRTHLRDLGLERRAVDAVFRALPVVSLPGYRRPMVRADDCRRLLETHTYDDAQVRP